MGKNWVRRIIAAGLSLCLAFTVTPVSATELQDVPLSEKFGGGVSALPESTTQHVTYHTYRETLTEKYLSADVCLTAALSSAMETEKVDGKDACRWTEEMQELSWVFTVEEAGLYNLALEYYLDGEKAYIAKRNLYVDEQCLFEESIGLTFTGRYVEQNKGKVNTYGDQIRGDNVLVNGWQTFELTDASGICDMPFEFYFAPGEHKVTLAYEDKNMYVGALTVKAARQLPAYADVLKEYEKKGYAPVTETELTFEAEETVAWTNDVTIRRTSSSDVTVTPYDYTKKLLNSYGGGRWDTGAQTICWTIQVPKSGLYKLGMRTLTNFTDGLPVYRQIAIDGKVPFSQMLSYKFPYKSSFDTVEITDEDGDAYLFYLEEGEHTLTITAKQGDMAGIIDSIEQDMALLSAMQLEIKKLTGSDVDPNYDYLFFKNIPELKGQFETLIRSLSEKSEYLKTIAGGNPSVASSLKSIQVQMENLVEDPFSIAKNYADIENAQITLGTWYTALLSAGMQVDKIYVNSPEVETEDAKQNIFKTIWAMLVSLWLSFTRSYNAISGSIDESVEITDEIDVWIARGTEWAQAIKDLADESFTPETGILVNVKTVPSSQLNAGSANVLLLSITSGTQPDVALAVSQSSPVDFAIRGAVADLTQFSDYEEVANRFYSETLVPYAYRGGVYALPETMDFQVLFYRKDIISDLGISIPNTRQELYANTLPALYSAGYEFYYPRDEKSFILQYGGSFYNENGTVSALDSPQVYEALQEATGVYTQYGVPVSASFYNRFRTGEMPMGIGSFALYLQLLTAAPEVSGLWGVALVPGLAKEDGTVDRTTAAFGSTSDVILSNTGKEQQSWEFLKWWSSTETQQAFCQEIEASLGTEARWNTANIEAFESLSWKKADIEVIRTMMEADREIPNVVGGYYTTRHLTNLWNKVVVNGANLRDSLEEAVEEINKELRMKQEEYGITNE